MKISNIYVLIKLEIASYRVHLISSYINQAIDNTWITINISLASVDASRVTHINTR